MPASRAPRALRRADVEPKPYLAVVFLPCGVIMPLLPVCDAAVALLRVPVHKACYDAGFARAGACGEKHMWLGIAVWQALCV